MSGQEERRTPNRFAVRMSDLEGDAHIDRDALVEELGEPPAPDVIPEWERRRAEYLTWLGAGG